MDVDRNQENQMQCKGITISEVKKNFLDSKKKMN